MLNITRATGELLAVLVRAAHARRILEIGTSNGYSTLWLAEAAAAIGGRVTTVEAAPHKIELAHDTFARSGLAAHIHAVHEDAGALLARTLPAACDLIFLDAERSAYPDWWPQIKTCLSPGGLLVVDNALSHAEELAGFFTTVRADPEFTATTLPVGNGEFLAVRSTTPRQ